MKLFIGNLSYETTEAELLDVLAEFDPILDFHRPLDRETGRPRGFAFVTLENREKGEAAVTKLNGVEMGGRKLHVNEAEDRRAGGGAPPRPPRRREFDEDGEGGGDEMRVAPKKPDDRPVDKDGNRTRYKGI
ncbi:MAG: cold-inducible RNA-binding protein [Verrucomicrobiales bacterium]|jgi:cold-inducible RNA-binding protein